MRQVEKHFREAYSKENFTLTKNTKKPRRWKGLVDVKIGMSENVTRRLREVNDSRLTDGATEYHRLTRKQLKTLKNDLSKINEINETWIWVVGVFPFAFLIFLIYNILLNRCFDLPI